MCGICGFFDPRIPSPRAALDAMTKSLEHRGPDGLGVWLGPDQAIGLGHTRLSVIDLKRGQQPMHSTDGRYVIVFNGEIYNYQVLRQELEQFGHRFSTDSDTEVLLKLYARHGRDMFARIRGMYAFAIWDGERRELLLADELRRLPEPSQTAADKSYDETLTKLYDGLDAVLKSYERSPAAARSKVFQLWRHD